MAFGYPILYANGLNNNTQLRRSTDMVYQRGGNYNIVLTGDTFESSMELDVDLYGDGTKVGRMSLVPFDTSLSGSTYYYSFNLRPYDYMSNYVQTAHYSTYIQNNWRVVVVFFLAYGGVDACWRQDLPSIPPQTCLRCFVCHCFLRHGSLYPRHPPE
jgi:hypothetical protein